MTNEWQADTPTAARQVVPFQQFILKIHSRCNLACTYCYMYQTGDRSWLSRPKVMAQEIIRRTARRIAEHAEEHGLPRVEVVLHGGEPLLAGASVIADAATELRAALPAGTELDLAVQTNGIRLNKRILDVLRAHRIRVGVSIDGALGAHDRRRRFADGRGSYAATVRGLNHLDDYRDLFAGLLCVIDPTEDPIGTYESLLAFAPPRVDFLLPHGNWSTPPPHRSADADDAPYGRWLTTVFDHWYDNTNQRTEVRLFTEIMNLVLGGQSRTESVGLSPVALVTVNTDGSLEQVDSLRVAYHGAASTGLNVTTHSFADALAHPSVIARQTGLAALADSCQRCAIRQVCGGGHYAHRYRHGTGFRNPSVYCPDLTALITHVVRRVRTDLAAMAG